MAEEDSFVGEGDLAEDFCLRFLLLAGESSFVGEGDLSEDFCFECKAFLTEEDSSVGEGDRSLGFFVVANSFPLSSDFPLSSADGPVSSSDDESRRRRLRWTPAVGNAAGRCPRSGEEDGFLGDTGELGLERVWRFFGDAGELGLERVCCFFLVGEFADAAAAFVAASFCPRDWLLPEGKSVEGGVTKTESQ